MTDRKDNIHWLRSLPLEVQRAFLAHYERLHGKAVADALRARVLRIWRRE